ncbi:MAG: hypothetical protein EAZ42_11425 [Verrucomicrobia bacterium]|nr:MAG: hypothetical protein EAZ42_11425 [Verrucomicrobiota bacterium]
MLKLFFPLCRVLIVLFTCAISAKAQLNAPINCYAFADSEGATIGTRFVKVFWTDNSTTETRWQVQVSINGANYVNLSSSFASNSTSDRGDEFSVPWDRAPANSNLRFRVFAETSSRRSASSNIGEVGTKAFDPPFNLVATAISPFHIRLTWSEDSTTETGFAIDQKIGSGPWIYVGNTAKNILSRDYKVGIIPSTSYQFRVRTYKGSEPTTPGSPSGSNVTPYAAPASVTTPAYTFTAAAVGSEERIRLTWASIPGATSYQIFMRDSEVEPFTRILTASSGTTTTDVIAPLVKRGRTYIFYIRPMASAIPIGDSNTEFATIDGITSRRNLVGITGAPLTHIFTENISSSITSRTLVPLPAGLTFDPLLLTLSGNFPAPGVYPMTYTVNLETGSPLTQAFTIRVENQSGSPTLLAPIPAWNTTPTSQKIIDLTPIFTANLEGPTMRISTTLGDLDCILFDHIAPQTVSRFTTNSSNGKYNNTAFHRRNTDRWLETGLYRGTGIGGNFSTTINDIAAQKEAGYPNILGTLSMIELAGTPENQRTQFRINTTDNSAELDELNDGQTVFARLATPSLAIADLIHSKPIGSYSLTINSASPAVLFPQFPMNASSAPASMVQANVIKILSVLPVAPLRYEVFQNSNPAVVSATIAGSQLELNTLSIGSSTITLRATDLDGLIVDTSFTVNSASAAITYHTWKTTQTFPNSMDAMLADADEDGLKNLEEYAFLGNPGTPDRAKLPELGRTTDLAFQTMKFKVRKGTAGLRYVVEANNALSGTWLPIWASEDGFAHSSVVSATDFPSHTEITIKDTLPISSEPKRFMRVRVIHD